LAAVHSRRFGDCTDFTRFIATYGQDLRHGDGFEELCRLRELQMIAMNARPGRSGGSSPHRRPAAGAAGTDHVAHPLSRATWPTAG
jgi:hypothetical protein